jgi:hypothetical protein
MSRKHLQHMSICATSSIYFCNIHMKQLQQTSETSETLETYICIIQEGSAYVSQFRPSVWEPAASGGVRAPLVSSTSGAREHHRPHATGTRHGSAVRAARATGKVSTTSTSARTMGGAERRVRRGTSEQRWMGCVTVARGVHVRVQDGAAARHCDTGGGSRRDKNG